MQRFDVAPLRFALYLFKLQKLPCNRLCLTTALLTRASLKARSFKLYTLQSSEGNTSFSRVCWMNSLILMYAFAVINVIFVFYHSILGFQVFSSESCAYFKCIDREFSVCTSCFSECSFSYTNVIRLIENIKRSFSLTTVDSFNDESNKRTDEIKRQKRPVTNVPL